MNIRTIPEVFKYIKKFTLDYLTLAPKTTLTYLVGAL